MQTLIIIYLFVDLYRVYFEVIKSCEVQWIVSLSFFGEYIDILHLGYIVNALERRLGMDLNGDGYIGGMGNYRDE